MLFETTHYGENFNLDFTVTKPESVEVEPESGTNPNDDKVIDNLVLASITLSRIGSF